MPRIWSINSDLFRAGVAAGNSEKYSTVERFGYNASVGTSFEDLWTPSSDITYMTSASTLTLASTTVEDDPDKGGGVEGTGAHTVLITGLDGNYAVVSESLNLNGTSGVTTANSYLRVHQMVVTAAGARGSNQGTVTLKNGSNTQAEILADDNETLMALYTVPAGFAAYVRHVYFNVGKNDDTDIRLQFRPPGQVFQTKARLRGFQQNALQPFDMGLSAAEKTDIRLQAQSSLGGVEVAGGFQFLLVKS